MKRICSTGPISGMGGVAALLVALFLAQGSAEGGTVGSAITYQGYLKVANAPANGTYDFDFRLYDAATGGSVVGPVLIVSDLAVSGGVFATPLDFGVPFGENKLFLEIAVRPGDSPDVYTKLEGRVPILPVPSAHYSLQAASANTAGNADTVDGQHASAFALAGHRHSSLTPEDGLPADAVSVDQDGNLVLSTGVMELQNGMVLEGIDGNNVAFYSGNGASGRLDVTFVNGDTTLQGAPGQADGRFLIAPSEVGTPANGHTMYIGGGGTDNVGEGDGGDLVLYGGAGAGIAGQGSAGGNGGDVLMSAGDGHGTVAQGGGNVSIHAGLASTSGGANGTITISTRDSITSNAKGGDVIIKSGAGAVSGTGSGGTVWIIAGSGAGNASSAGGDGGDIVFHAGHGRGTGNNDGGVITLTPGSPVGSGQRGYVLVQGRLGLNRTNPAHPIHAGAGTAVGNGAHLTGGGVWTNGSDVNSKTAFEELDNKEILARVLALPITKWQYKGEPADVRHIGPMAQDFKAAFNLGESDTHIGTVDADGVALAAIKGLHEQTQEEITQLKAENAELRAQLAAMQATLATLVTKE